MSLLGAKNDKVILVNADLAGTCRNKGFIEKYPERAFNVGIAEQNMISFASGLASEGFRPYAFGMAPFLSMRSCEQVRTDVAYGNRNVKMIGVYAGVSGGISGATHWGLEDVGIMTSIPNIAVVEVSDANMTKRVMDMTLYYDKPLYIRCGVEPTKDIYEENIKVKLGGSITVREGEDGVILTSGVLVQYACEAAEDIERETKQKIRVVDMYSLKPIDKEAIISAAKTGKILIAQDHNIIGGLGSIIAQVLIEQGIRCRVKIAGIKDEFMPMAHAPFLYKKYGLDAEGLASQVKELFT